MVSSIIHNPKALIAVIVVAVIAGISIVMYTRKKSQTPPQNAGSSQNPPVAPQTSSSLGATTVPATQNMPPEPQNQGTPPIANF